MNKQIGYKNIILGTIIIVALVVIPGFLFFYFKIRSSIEKPFQPVSEAVPASYSLEGEIISFDNNVIRVKGWMIFKSGDGVNYVNVVERDFIVSESGLKVMDYNDRLAVLGIEDVSIGKKAVFVTPDSIFEDRQLRLSEIYLK